MTKTEFRQQFRRLRVAGYRLPVQEGITVDDLMDEWYQTFGNCSAGELAAAIDALKKLKTDTFWPAPGELWAQIFEVRKSNRIRQSGSMTGEWPETPPHVRKELAESFRQFAAMLSKHMAMPKVSEGVAHQDEPDHVLLEREMAREDDEESA